MKNRKSLTFITGIMAIAAMFVIFSSAYAQTSSDAPKVYICAMCTDVSSDKPGDCPKCGMTMVIKDEKSDTKMNMSGCTDCNANCCTMENCCKGEAGACKGCCSTMKMDSKSDKMTGCKCCR